MESGWTVPQSNDELAEFLVELGALLKDLGETRLSDELTSAARYRSGSPSEFLHEAQRALREVVQALPEDSRLLARAATATIEQTIAGIDDAFRRVGGA
jgi:hypothetical protein